MIDADVLRNSRRSTTASFFESHSRPIDMGTPTTCLDKFGMCGQVSPSLGFGRRPGTRPARTLYLNAF